MRAKFNIGDKVRFNNRVPIYVRDMLRCRVRTITDFESTHEHRVYRLGIQGKGSFETYGFHSYQLIPASDNQKQKYNHKRTRYKRG